jgi:hypothetical protein
VRYAFGFEDLRSQTFQSGDDFGVFQDPFAPLLHDTATREYIAWCLETYAQVGWKGLKKKITKAKYREITSHLPQVEVVETLKLDGTLPPLAGQGIISEGNNHGHKE